MKGLDNAAVITNNDNNYLLGLPNLKAKWAKKHKKKLRNANKERLNEYRQVFLFLFVVVL